MFIINLYKKHGLKGMLPLSYIIIFLIGLILSIPIFPTVRFNIMGGFFAINVPIGRILIYMINLPGLFIAQMIPNPMDIQMLPLYYILRISSVFICSITTYFFIGFMLDAIIMKVKKPNIQIRPTIK